MMGPDASSCLDLDECTIDPEVNLILLLLSQHLSSQVCGQGKCQNVLGSFKCICDDGFSIKERMEEGCTDDNECDLDLYHCDPFAQCKNTNGSYDCICREGFSGDGFSCQVKLPFVNV